MQQALAILSESCQLLTYSKDDSIIEQGIEEEEEAMYIIVTGTVGVYVTGVAHAVRPSQRSDASECRPSAPFPLSRCVLILARVLCVHAARCDGGTLSGLFQSLVAMDGHERWPLSELLPGE